MGGETAASSPAGCLEQGPWRQRVAGAVRRRADRLALAVIGVAVVVGPSVNPWLAEVRGEVLLLGVGILVLGVVLPSVAEAEVGLQGIRYRRLVEARDV